MHRMTHMKTKLFLVAAVTFVTGFTAGNPHVGAQPPRVRTADIDYEASGFVMPASGQMPPGAIAGLSPQGPMRAANYAANAGPGYVPPLASGGYGSPQAYGATQGYAPAGYAAQMPSQHPGVAMQNPIQQVGFFGGGCDSGCDGGCDGCGSYGMDPVMMYGGGCGGACGGMCGGTGACGMGGCYDGPCDDGGGVFSRGGVLGKLRHGGGSACGGCGVDGCGHCGGLTNLRHMCIFCRGEGCEACQIVGRGHLLGLLGALAPYTEGGRAAQRWFDLSAEALFLGHDVGGTGAGVITRQGAGPSGLAVLTDDNIDGGDLEVGVRLAASMIWGPGGSIEGVYMGGQEWNDSATASSPATIVDNTSFNPLLPQGGANEPFLITSGADLFSFITEFGTNPAGGFDDTDRSTSQTVEASSRFHSAELNYRRRTVGPYSRFQGSWLAGMRYFRFDNQLGLDIVGIDNDGTNAGASDGTLRFFNSTDDIENNLFGAQIGGDLWYNVMPGIQLGVELKGAWLKNEARRNYSISANSIAGGGPGTITDSFREDDGTLALEFSTQAIYRFSHSWSFRSAYYLIAIDEVGVAELDANFLRETSQGSFTGQPRVNFDSLVLNGFSFGAEYLW